MTHLKNLIICPYSESEIKPDTLNGFRSADFRFRDMFAC